MENKTTLTQNIEAEEYIIRSLFAQKCSLDNILDLDEDIFTIGIFREFLKSAKRLREKGEDINTGSIPFEMKSNSRAVAEFDRVGREENPTTWTGTEREILSFMLKKASQYGELSDATGSRIDAQIQLANLAHRERIIEGAVDTLKNNKGLSSENLLLKLKEVEESLSRVDSRNFTSIFDNVTEEDIIAEMSADHEGIGTRYYVYDDPSDKLQYRHEIKIPRGAITLVCGKPGHGKSTFLRNLALRLVAGKEEGEIIYLAYEESVKKIVPKFISLNFGDYIKTNGHREGGNIDRIRDYYKGEKGYITNLMAFEDSFKIFKSWRTSGRFKVISPTHSSRDIVAALRAHIAKPGVKVAAVFVDYIQFMKSGRLIKEKRLDINEILNDFLGFAKETDIPIIAAAQLAKETGSPESMSDDNIAESADLGRYADMVLCLWNSRKKSHVKKDSNYLSDDPDSHYQKHLKKRGFDFERGGHIYVKVCKARDIDSGADNVFTFNGNTGVVEEAPRSVWAVGDMPEELFAEQPQSGSTLSDDEFNRLRTQ